MLYPTELRAHVIAVKNGRGREIRTPDILLPKQARYQAALYPDITEIGIILGQLTNVNY